MAKSDDRELTQNDVLQQIAAALASVQTQAQTQNQTGQSEMRAALETMTKTLGELATRTRPENPEHPGISAYSYPEGDKLNPKPALKCEMFWVGYPLTVETLMPQEILALNTLKPGTYRVHKGNGVEIPFTVEGKTKMNGELESLWVQFPCKGDQSSDHASMVDYITEAMEGRVLSVSALQAELARVKQQLASAEAVIATA